MALPGAKMQPPRPERAFLGDSNSISRKGVGVRLPSLAPRSPAQRHARALELHAVAREVGEALWGVLGARLRAAREELEGASARARAGGVSTTGSGHAPPEELCARIRPTGWCLGVLAAAQGVDLLRARGEGEGLRWMMVAAAEARGLRLAPGSAELPLLRSGSGAAREVALLGAWCVLLAEPRGGGVLHWTRGAGESGAGLDFELARAPHGLAERCARLCLPGRESRLELSGSRLGLRWS
jgi:hypothetical protein